MSDEANNGVTGLSKLGVLARVVGVPGGDQALCDMFLQQGNSDAAEGLVCGSELGEDVDTVPAIVNHSGDAAHLALDLPEPNEQQPAGQDGVGHGTAPCLCLGRTGWLLEVGVGGDCEPPGQVKT